MSKRKSPSEKPQEKLSLQESELEAEISRLKAEAAIEKERIALEAQEREMREGLPHLYGDKFYPFMREYWDSKKDRQVVCAPNQVGKSSIQIRKGIDLATDRSKWKKLWPVRPDPRTFWYLYPNKNTATSEFYEKWEPEFLPRGKWKDDPNYGWEMEQKQGDVYAIHYKSGVSLYFKTYAQNIQDLQSGTVWWMGLDEETPVLLLPELVMRVSATDGYISAAFTATRAQIFWKRVIEGKGEKREWPDAFRVQVSLYDCTKYEDGSDSPWTLERIRKREQQLGSKAEVDKRIHGKFVADTGRLVEQFDEERHYKAAHPLPKDWYIYSAVDMGSGGQAHPAAITFVAVKPDFTTGRVFKFWRGDGVVTAATDVLQKYREMRGNLKPVSERYDYESAEFKIICEQQGEPFIKANKDRDAGYGLMNSLFKNDMLIIYDHDDRDPAGFKHSDKLVDELNTVKTTDRKQTAADDGMDSLRYAVMDIPWNFEAITPKVIPKVEEIVDERMAGHKKPEPEIDMIEAQFNEANEIFEDFSFEYE